MSNLGLFLVLVGPAAGLLLSTPRSPISAPLGKTALLSASLNFSASLPDYFQVRWRFVTRPRLVLIVKADNCQAENGTHRWLDACEISTEKAERYRHRAELATDDVSLILREVRLEDSGSYCITLLALGVKISANINLTVINEVDTSDTHDNGTTFDDQRRGIFPNKSTTVTAGGEAPASLVKVASDGDYTMSNIIQLSSAGLMLCLLGVIIAENLCKPT